MGHEIALSSERYKDDYDRDLPEMAHSPVGKMPPGEEGGWEQKVTSGMDENQRRLKVGEGAQEGGRYNTTEIRRESEVSDRRWQLQEP